MSRWEMLAVGLSVGEKSLSETETEGGKGVILPGRREKSGGQWTQLQGRQRSQRGWGK